MSLNTDRRMSRRPLVDRWLLVAVLSALGLVLAACGTDELIEDPQEPAAEEPATEETDGDAAAGEADGPSGPLAISVQPGIGYTSMIVMKQEGWLEEALPNMDIEWLELASGAAIRDAILAGDVSVGTGGVGPFYVGWDAGVGYRILSSMNNMDLWLMTMDDDIQSVADFDSDDRIAMPAPDSIQSVHLRKAAEEELGDPSALDANIVAMPHPDGVAALIGDQIAAHLTSPPFQFQERDEGARKILGSYDLWGPSTFNTIYVTEEYYEANREAMDILYDLHEDAVELINDDPERAGELLSQDAGGDPSAEEFTAFLTEEGIEFTTVPQGVLETGQFMADIGMIEKSPESLEEILLDRAVEAGGS